MNYIISKEPFDYECFLHRMEAHGFENAGEAARWAASNGFSCSNVRFERMEGNKAVFSAVNTLNGRTVSLIAERV